MNISLKVECRSGHRAEERPLRFRFVAAAGDSRAAEAQPADTVQSRTYEVRDVLDQWYGVGYECFRVRADDGNLYILRHNTEEDSWTLDSFRRERG
jgi:hypothetical protein